MTPVRRVALITGASSGIGEHLARELARQGWNLGLAARREERLQALANEIRQPDQIIAVASADVGDRESTRRACGQLIETLGPVDLLIANAGIGHPDTLNPLSVDRIESMIRINLLGVVYSIEAVLPAMLQRKQGHLAVVSSMAAYKGLAGSAGYCASKAGVTCFLEGLRVQLRDHGITTTTIHPGFVRTPMTDVNQFTMPFLVEPDDAARRILRAIERRVKVFNFPRRMNLLMRLLPLLPDFVLAACLPRKGDPTP